MLVGGSFTLEDEIRREGYKIIPNTFSLKAYETVFIFPGRLITGYKITIITTVAGTMLHLLVCTLAAYPLSLRQVKYRNIIQVYILITLVFNGGMVPWYYVCTRYLGLKNTIWSMILPMVANPFNIYLARNYFMSLPEELNESARIDGAGQLRIFFQIILPISTPIIATIGLFISLAYWNDWWNSIMLNDKPEFFSLQLVLRAIVSQVQFLRSNAAAAGYQELLKNMPSESVKLATAMLTAGPIILLYPFVQRYFVKGIMIGAVKG